MRGIFFLIAFRIGTIRFNPAYAGNIYSFNFAISVFKVQPRVCGEYCVRSIDKNDNTGSTPRMRGIFENVKLLDEFDRFNPAYAGNIDFGCRWGYSGRVQPRVCGEYFCLSL